MEPSTKTIGLLSLQDQNHYHHYGIVPAAPLVSSRGEGRYLEGFASRTFFEEAQDDEFFRLSRNRRPNDGHVWCFLGYRVFVEYFDENVMVDVQWALEVSGVSREEAVRRLAAKLAAHFAVRVVGENSILDVRCRRLNG